MEVAVIKHLKISEVFHVTGKGLCENLFSLKAVAGLEMSAVAKNTKGGHKGVVANILREKTGIFFKAYGNNNLNLFLGFVAKSSVTTVEFFFKFYKNP